MKTFKLQTISSGVMLAYALGAAGQTNPTAMKPIAHVDPRFESYNIEMVEVIGGRFWKPYDSVAATPAPAQRANGAAAGIDPNLFEQRKPIDLGNPRLRKMASALGPAYVRVSGTWANNLYVQDDDLAAAAAPPAGFGGTLTRAQWRGVIDFAHAVDAQLVTSFSVSPGTRDAKGVWTTAQAQRFLDMTHAMGGSIAAAEFINEPSFPSAAGLPPSYGGADFARDFAVFRTLMRKASPDTKILGPGSVGEGTKFVPIKLLESKEMLAALPKNSFDVFSWHFYGTVSQRCASTIMPGVGTTPGAALTEDWLSRTSTVEAFYRQLRDEYDPGKPMWVTETGQAACGGDRWAATFLDSFRYLDQLGRLAQKNVQVVVHNTLAASDYGLIDERTLTPRPNYWAALLWHRTMGETVLDPGRSPAETVRLYASCTAGKPGSVTVLAMNLSRDASAELHLKEPSARYTLTAAKMESHDVLLNQQPLVLTAKGDVPEFAGAPEAKGDLTLAPGSINFLVIASAHNAACGK